MPKPEYRGKMLPDQAAINNAAAAGLGKRNNKQIMGHSSIAKPDGRKREYFMLEDGTEEIINENGEPAAWDL